MNTTQRKEGAKRLRILAEFLDKEVRPTNRFTMQVWAGLLDETRNTGFSTTEEGPALQDCGTHACIAGWATAVPQFRALGLKYQEGIYLAGAGVYRSIDALEDFFSLSSNEVDKLFLQWEDPSSLDEAIEKVRVLATKMESET